MKRCEFKRLRDKSKEAADRLSEQFAATYQRMIEEDPQGPAARLANACATSKTLDRDFLARLANGEFLTPIDEMGLDLCEDIRCRVCH